MSELQKSPLVTLTLFAYNQERFVREAVQAALNQDYEKLEIILSDDCSTDSTFEIINSIASDYSGPHEIIINRNPVNLGLAKHFSEIVKRARGEIIIVAAGDDISLPTRVSKTVEIFSSEPNATIVSFTDTVIDVDGKERARARKQGPIELRKICLEDYLSGRSFSLSGASRGFRKKIFDIFGDLNDTCPTEDSPYILRGLMIGHALVSADCGILYRQHGKNLSGPNSLHMMNFQEIKKQYLCDANFACHENIITEDSMCQIKNYAEKNYRRRKSSGDFYNAPQKLKFFIGKVILNKDFKIREKARMLLSIF